MIFLPNLLLVGKRLGGEVLKFPASLAYRQIGNFMDNWDKSFPIQKAESDV